MSTAVGRKLGKRSPTLLSFWAYSQLVRSAKCVRHGTTTLVEGDAWGRRKRACYSLGREALLHPRRRGLETSLATWFSCPCPQNPRTRSLYVHCGLNSPALISALLVLPSRA